MKWLFVLLFFLSCGPHYKNQAEVVVTYEGVVESHTHPAYNTEIEFRDALDDDVSPDFIIFSAEWCNNCIDLRHLLVNLGWRDKVIVLNLQEDWVRYIANVIGIQSIPAMVIDYDNGKSISPIYVGQSSIAKEIFEHLETKK